MNAKEVFSHKVIGDWDVGFIILLLFAIVGIIGLVLGGVYMATDNYSTKVSAIVLLIIGTIGFIVWLGILIVMIGMKKN